MKHLKSSSSLSLHNPVSPSIFHSLTLSVFHWFEGCCWQMTISFPFRRGHLVLGWGCWCEILSHGKAITVTLNPRQRRRERRCDREAIHSRHYRCLCGWHPQMGMCGSTCACVEACLGSMIFKVSQSNLLPDAQSDPLIKSTVMWAVCVTVLTVVIMVIRLVGPILDNGDNDNSSNHYYNCCGDESGMCDCNCENWCYESISWCCCQNTLGHV